MARARRGVDRPALHGAQEGALVGHAEPDLALGGDAVVRAERGEPLRDRRVDAAVHEPQWLLEGLPDPDLPANYLVGALEQLEAVVAVERRELEEPGARIVGRRHG